MNSELQHQLDRLADAELSAEEMSNLLQTIDSEDAWKQCALTLIESAELRRALRQMMGDHPPVVVAARPAYGRTRTLVLAACLATVAFLVGRSSFVPGQPSVNTPPSIADRRPAEQPLEQAPETAPEQPPADGIAVVGFAQVVRTGGVSPRYPVLSGRFTDTDLMQLTAIPEHVRRRARSKGIEMQRVPRVLTMQLEDGQRLAVPMDALGLRQATAEVL